MARIAADAEMIRLGPIEQHHCSLALDFQRKASVSMAFRPIEKVTRPARKLAAHPTHQLSRELLRILDRLGCFSFGSANVHESDLYLLSGGFAGTNANGVTAAVSVAE
jgi:hypothetical protein